MDLDGARDGAYAIPADVNLLAIDFDLTLVDVHTEGRWSRGVDALARHARPFFLDVVRRALKANVHVAVVTFSPQTELIGDVLRVLFPGAQPDIIVRGNDDSWVYNGTGGTDGKQAHIASAVEQLHLRGAGPVSRRSTLLFDDDICNVRAALKAGVRALWYIP